jgi:hypothetical protein
MELSFSSPLLVLIGAWALAIGRRWDWQGEGNRINIINYILNHNVALAEWLRRVPAKYMGFPRESSNLSGDVTEFFGVLLVFVRKLTRQVVHRPSPNPKLYAAVSLRNSF